MAATAACPSCGAPVSFRSNASVFAVCEYCLSTLVRQDLVLEDIGKMAALAEDRSPLQLGSEGQWQGIHFSLIGRIQLEYSQGFWNEWHLLFDDMRTGWLSEAGGHYAVSFLEHPQEMLPAFETLKVGQRFLLNARPWTVSNIEQARCVAGQGELPFKVGAGYPVPAVDLRNGPHFATLDYSTTPPLLFIGETVLPATLQLTNLRPGAALPTHTVEAQVFRCPSCGIALTVRSEEILAVGCTSCGAVIDPRSRNHELLSRALSLRDEKLNPSLPIGSQGVLDGEKSEVIGFLVRRTTVEGISYEWREYLLASTTEGQRDRYRWLSEYNGHWNLGEVLSSPPAISGALESADIRFSDQQFRHFSSCTAEVIQVAGEFPWRVRCGETCRVSDYVAPPLMLSRETSETELSWSQSRYLDPEAVQSAFKPEGRLPATIGIYANQPNPWADTHQVTCRRFWKIALLALLLQAFFYFGNGAQLLLRQDFQFVPSTMDSTQKTREFEITGRSTKLTLRQATSLDNNWMALDIALINKSTGESWPVSRDLSFYSGYDSDGSWSEGSREDEVVFPDIPPGTYYLTIDPEVSSDRPVAVQDRIEVWRGGAGWSNFILLMIVLVAFPVFSRMRHAAFETQRWLESDHPPVVSTDQEED